MPEELVGGHGKDVVHEQAGEKLLEAGGRPDTNTKP